MSIHFLLHFFLDEEADAAEIQLSLLNDWFLHIIFAGGNATSDGIPKVNADDGDDDQVI